jgi:hypothetical protein
MRKIIMSGLAGILWLASLPAIAAEAADRPVIPCDQPGANPGGTTAMDHTTAPCDTGVINDTGNTSVTGPEATGSQRLPPESETKQLPPPHNPNPSPRSYDN